MIQAPRDTTIWLPDLHDVDVAGYDEDGYPLAASLDTGRLVRVVGGPGELRLETDAERDARLR